MCGIACIISSDPARLAQVGAMVNAQLHRGPDHHATWTCPTTGLAAMGHTRLALLDLSPAGDQPMVGTRYAISYNGEVYNHHELRAAHFPGHKWRGTSDTETVLELIHRYGVAATLPMLRGMWAMAVWDMQERVLYCATDPFGIKPLYYHHDTAAHDFACASTSAALVGRRTSWSLDMRRLREFFVYGGTTAVRTGMDRMRGGQLLTYTPSGKVQVNQWYTPTFRPDAAQAMPALLEQAMRRVQLSDLQVGLFLSGGVDSSTAAKWCKGPAFHLASRETDHARTVAEHYDLPLCVVQAEQDQVLVAHQHISRTSGEPTMAGHIPWLVSRKAAQTCKAAISANGADEIFFGYARTAREEDRTELLGMWTHLTRASGLRNWGDIGSWSLPLPEMDERFPFDARTRMLELRTYVEQDLNPTLDAASMAHGLEMRVPFLDTDLVEAALSLPHTWHGNKQFLRDHLLRERIPHRCVHRPKVGFSMRLQPTELQRTALEHVQRNYGLSMHHLASPRDKSYVQTCAVAIYAWEQEQRNAHAPDRSPRTP